MLWYHIGFHKGRRTTQYDVPRSVLFQLSGEGPSFQLCPVRLPPKAKILRVGVGTTHYIALTSDTLVYTWGEGKRGELGYQPTDWQEEPKLVEALLSKSIAL
ncbi:unnamed protein product [Nezara viridula]|uniref:Uncharacterized protein n=1 Tax=Nezara viridula TaxID=85310 RepID=A0A9P0HN70_NEZVI|nr:unnamed protein product [Nezara viridula]